MSNQYPHGYPQQHPFPGQAPAQPAPGQYMGQAPTQPAPGQYMGGMYPPPRSPSRVRGPLRRMEALTWAVRS